MKAERSGGRDGGRKGHDDLAFDTRAVHAGREDLCRLGVHAPPLDLSTTYPVGDLGEAVESMASLVAGGPPRGSSIYARMHNPTVDRFEKALAGLEGAEAGIAFGSGMAAVTAAMLATRRGLDGKGSRSHVVAVRPLYGGTDGLLAGGVLGFETSFVGPEGVAAAIRPDTALVIMETPANPTLDLVDIRDIVRQAGAVPVLVDSTFATPVLQRPLEHGAAMVLHSGTKYLGGHGDVIAGVIATSEAWARRVRQVRVATGALLHPLAGYLLHRGLPTLALRVRASQEGARYLAERLAVHPAVVRVCYPGLPGADPHGLIGRQMAGPGGLLAFEMAGGFEAARALLGNVHLMMPAVSLGATDTLIQHPAGLTHGSMSAEARKATGISAGLLRISVGIEAPRDLWADLEGALARVEQAQLSAAR
jgi:methionine-gamma-lyase